MDNRMVDNEEQRADRKRITREDLTPEQLEQVDANRLPNRRTRRMVAKRRGVFKHPGAWGYVNGGRAKNKSIRRKGHKHGDK